MFKCEGCNQYLDDGDKDGNCPACGAELCINCSETYDQMPCCGMNREEADLCF